ncbi:uncharacterized protein EV420DRAFT_1517053 [Desarmillaria tabescens]|uniref:VHS domain-containing protein n=1 Tax=Armillaria tabescens TaxID=1929756 RepID=A0AA39NFA4_ARMTA|nr:uncharacterized protein EV420DRAFT_1517053 [Desarmillaria tabescens]KAK0464587.1 hypothetical protein EV420DRAFT_1517053 [Desarmillaria tabescens]
MLSSPTTSNWLRASPLESLITRSCDPSLPEPNYALHIEVANYINTKKANTPREAAMLTARLANNRNPHIAILALALLDTLVQSCGYPFHLQISYQGRPPPFPGPVMSRILELLHSWKEGICVESSCKELIRRGTPRDLAAAQELMKSLAGANPDAKPDYKTQALTDLNKLESKVILLNEMLDNVDTERGERIVSGDVYEQVASILTAARPKIQKWISDAETHDPESWINDQINTALDRYEAYKKETTPLLPIPYPPELSSTRNDPSSSSAPTASGPDDLAGLFGSVQPQPQPQPFAQHFNNGSTGTGMGQGLGISHPASQQMFASQQSSFSLPQQSFNPPQQSFSPPQQSFSPPQRAFAPIQGSMQQTLQASPYQQQQFQQPSQPHQPQPQQQQSNQTQGKDPFDDLVGLF